MTCSNGQESINPIVTNILPIALSDDLLFHAILSVSAFHVTTTQPSNRTRNTDIARFYHHGQALRLLEERISNRDQATTDTTITTIIILASCCIYAKDMAAFDAHVRGLEKAVALRGGIDKLGMDDLLHQLVNWARFQLALIRLPYGLYKSASPKELRVHLDSTHIPYADAQEHVYPELSKRVVGLDDRSCACGLFWEYQSPCSHATKAARIAKIDPFSLFSRKYQLHSYQICYQTVMAPLLIDGLEIEDVLPPLVLAERRRPLKRRLRKRVSKQEKSNKCSNLRCRQEGHQKRRCMTVQTCAGIIEIPDDYESISISPEIWGNTPEVLQVHDDNAKECDRQGLRTNDEQLRAAREEIEQDIRAAALRKQAEEKELNVFWGLQATIRNPPVKGKQKTVELLDSSMVIQRVLRSLSRKPAVKV